MAVRNGFGGRVAHALKVLLVVFFAVLSLYPFVWVLLSSLKDNTDIYANPFGIPRVFHPANYADAWQKANVGAGFGNSMVICVLALALLVVLTAMGSYVLTRVRPNRWLSGFFALGLMIPLHALLIPTLILYKDLQLTDKVAGMVLIYAAVNIPISMFIVSGFMQGIPAELDEAATIDGCGRAGTFFRVILPVATPGVATVATLSFLNIWNDLLFGLVLISTPAKRTLAVCISVLKGSYATQYGLLCAGLAVSILPVILMYLLFQKQIVQGMTAGAVKG